MAEKLIMDSILFLVGGGVGSLVTVLGITRTMISKTGCKDIRELFSDNVETKLDVITDSLTEIKEFQDRLYRDFYEPRIKKED